jgi:RNA ligase (TIGR02306 family)
MTYPRGNMSSLIVPVAKIRNVRPHPNADSLELAEILGWQVVIQKGAYAEGELVVYCPPDSVMPQELSDAIGVTGYLSNGRVRQIRLRGEASFGLPIAQKFITDVDLNEVGEGFDLAETLGIKKYVAPLRSDGDDIAPDRADVPKYTNIEHIKNFPDLFAGDEEVVVTEKIHGANCRVGIVDGTLVAGSRGNLRKPPQSPDGVSLVDYPDTYKFSLYWSPLALESVRNLLQTLAASYKQVILYGEVYGKGVQSLTYGDERGFRAFDLLIDGSYVSYQTFSTLCDKYELPRVPELYRGRFDKVELAVLSRGNSTLEGANNIKEGVVVKPVKERHDPAVGRVIVKYLSDDFVFSKNSDFNDK